MTADELQAMKRARALITDPEHWTQDAFARDKAGTRLTAHDPSAVSWCMAGAVIKCGGARMYAPFEALRAMATEKGYERLPVFNDYSDHATVLAAFDEVIARAEVLLEAEAVLSTDSVEITEEPVPAYT